MRKVNYQARKKDGTVFFTTCYKEATQDARIEKTFFTPIEEVTEREKARMREHVQKIREKRGF